MSSNAASSTASGKAAGASLGTPAPTPAEEAATAASVAASSGIRLLPFGFAQRTNFDASRDLQKTRSRHFGVPPAPPDNDIWRRPPPDFRPQAWAPRPPKRNSRDAVQPWRYSLDSDARYAARRRADVAEADADGDEAAGGGDRLPRLSTSSLRQPQRMQTLFRLVRPDTAKRRSVQEGALARDQYAVQRPHDFRQYPPIQSLGLPEFITAADRDPYNIEFLTRKKDTIVGPLHDIQNIRDASGTLWSAVRQPPKWDPRQHLEQSNFPSRPCAYSRYRPQNRNPFEAFMDTVEVGLEKRWLAEKLHGNGSNSSSTDAAADSGKRAPLTRRSTVKIGA